MAFHGTCQVHLSSLSVTFTTVNSPGGGFYQHQHKESGYGLKHMWLQRLELHWALGSFPSESKLLPSYFQRSSPRKTDLQDLCFPRGSGKPLQNTDGVPIFQLLPRGSRPQIQPACLPCGGKPLEPRKHQAKIGKYTSTYFFHNRLKFTLGTI